MPDHNVIADVSETLRHVLDTHMISVGQVDVVIFDLHGALPQSQNPILTLTLNEILEDPSARNRPRVREPDPNGVKISKPKLTLLLKYLLTAWSDDPATVQKILGRVVQVFYNKAILSGSDLQGVSLPTEAEALKLTLAPLTLEDRARIWYAVQKPYRLCLTYDVRVVNIQVFDVEPVPVVSSREVDYGVMETVP
ncbi:MAG: DUF4255 domain-containing protein [Gemmatimonadales bacterium]